ncbi:hypothetical protein GUJ93_ZPchr0010g8411 [Zizania palustris]|uniref:Uncharacterized protein n=1 Tax=Zizania palustris TaxID=103762 RepID=A0A8J6BFE1_ZIZPA|nr:hypothetical protein GUJ93_ZPchr0010g8411 [Zizania palustris]
MEGVGARLGRTSARYGPATTFTGPVRKWRKEWVPVAAAAASATAAAAAAAAAASLATGTGSGGGYRGNSLVLFKWTPLSGSNGAGDGEQASAAGAAEEEKATRRRWFDLGVLFGIRFWLV